MDAKTQIIVLLFSYLFGLVFYPLYLLNKNLIKDCYRSSKSFITILFMYNIVLIYLICLYKLNQGIFHIYFLILLILGFISSYHFLKKMLKNVKIRNFLAKIKKKCYTKRK